jgi:hypothetical protein
MKSPILIALVILSVMEVTGCGGGSSGSSSAPPPNPVPAISSLSPSSATTGGASLTLTVNGTNFISSSTVQWNGASLTATFASATQLTAAITATDIATAGNANITVVNPTPGGGTSAATSFAINNPAPSVSSLTPASALQGGSSFTLTVNGSNFVANSAVQWNGASLTTTFVSATQLTAAITAADIATAGTASVTVINPAPGGGTSQAQTFTIAAPAPTVSLSINPTSITAGTSAMLIWSSTNATSCTASGAWSGSQPANGSQSVTPTTSGSFAYSLACTGAGGTANGSANLAVLADLTSIEDASVSGSPATGNTTYSDGLAVSYSYAPASGFSDALVEVDGALSPASGSITMHGNHWIWAFGQPTSGTSFSGYMTAPTDPTVIPFPRFYSQQGTGFPVVVPDPYCTIQSSFVAYPANFLGSFSIPLVNGAPLPASVKRGVALKDFWGGSTTDASLNGCSDPLHTAFADTIPRIQILGADHLAVTTWASVVDGSSATPVLDLTNPQISPSEMAYITSTAKAAGLDVWLFINVPSTDEQGVALPTAPTQQWETSFLNSYAQFIEQTAQLAQQYGIKVMMLNWRDYYIDLTNYTSVYGAAMVPALAQVRTAFQGKLLLYDVFPSTITSDIAPLFSGVDAILVDPYSDILDASENQNITLSLVKEKYQSMFQAMTARYAPFSKPLDMNVFAESYRNYLENGWIEDAMCTDNCIEETVQTDFSVQAIAYEALFEAASESDINFMSFETYGYWYVDVILPDQSFPNISESPRDKPAEAIIQQWFAQPQ